MPESRILGQLLVMQSMLNNLPSEDSIFSFIAKGLKDIPGVENINLLTENLSNLDTGNGYYLIKSQSNNFAALDISFYDKDLFHQYEDYLKNFIFMVGVILEERRQRDIIQKHQTLLEKKVEERTRLLKEEIEKKEKIEESLRLSDERYELAVHATNDGIFDWNVITNELYHSPKWKSILGYKVDEIKNEYSEWERLTKPEDIERALKVLAEHVSGKRDRYECEIRMLHKDGRWVSILARGFAVKDKEGKVVRVVGTHTDLTDRKNVEKAIIENQRLSAIGEMSSAVAHDFNNSLQSIFGNLDLALLDNEISTHTRKYLETIKIATIDAATRVQELQRFGGKKKRTSSYSSIKLNNIVRQVILQSRPLWKDSMQHFGYEIIIDTKFEGEPCVLGNSSEIRSVLYNIVKNSVEAMSIGGSILFETGIELENCFIRVSDTGKGMDVDTQKRIFQPFFSTKDFEKGRGLGMSSAFSIIKEHKGSIRVRESVVDQGTTIEFIIPKFDCCIEDFEREIKNEANYKINILWIDDDEMIRDLAVEMIKTLGHRGDLAESGAKALELIETNTYDLIVTDIGMPGMNGWQLLSEIKDKFNLTSKIAVLTGWGDEISNKEQENYRVDYLFSKPFTFDQLDTLINSVSQKSK